MKFHHTAIAVLLIGLFNLTVQADVVKEGAKVGEWTMDFDAAVKLAGEKKLPMMLNFTGSDWCGWCKLMDKGVFAEEEWKTYASTNAVLVTLDFPKDQSIVPEKYVERNKKLQAQFGVQGFPTYVVLDSDGKSKLGQLGAGKDKTPSSFIKEFKGVTRLSATNMAAYAKAHPDKIDAFKAAIAESKKMNQELKDWIGTRPQQNEENNKKYADFQERIQKADAKLAEFE